MKLIFQVLAILLIFVLVVVALYVSDIKKEEKEKKRKEEETRLKYEFERTTAWENAQKEMAMREEIKKATKEAYKPKETPIVPNQDLFMRRDPETKQQNPDQLPFKMPYFQNLGGIEKFASQNRKETSPHYGEFAGFKRGSMSLGENKFGTSENADVSVYSRGGRIGPAPIQPRRNLADMFGYDTSIGTFTADQNKSEDESKAIQPETPKKSSSKGKSKTAKKSTHKQMDALSQLRSEEFNGMNRR